MGGVLVVVVVVMVVVVVVFIILLYWYFFEISEFYENTKVRYSYSQTTDNMLEYYLHDLRTDLLSEPIE
jgi:flagellar basal body-associated protein FliL